MSDIESSPLPRKASTVKTIWFVVIAVAIIIIAIWGIRVATNVVNRSTSSTKTTSSGVQNPTLSPDTTKVRNASPAPNTPSSSGTGPGSENSLLGPQ